MAEFLLRLLVWGIAPLLLVALAVGPRRAWGWVRGLWAWATDGRQAPAAVIERIVKEQEKKIHCLKDVLQQSETAQAEIVRNMRKSQESIKALEREARSLAAAEDDLGAKAALYKLNLEQMAIGGFEEQLAQQKARIDQARRRLHLLELQLRQYEVGRTILLAQLAEARTLEQQYALASQFDPSGAVAAWTQAEGQVHQAAQTARAAEQVYHDTADLPLSGQPLRIEPGLLEAQLSELKAQIRQGERRASS
jgi:phage shock protein A